MEGSGTTLDTFPNLSCSRGGRLSTNERIDSGLKLSKLALNKAGLSESCAEEGSVDSDQDPGALSKGDGGEEKTTPEKDLENGNEAHGSIIVFLDKLANQISSGIVLVSWLSTWGGGWGGDLRRLESWNQVGASICCDMEYGVDTEWKHSQRVLG